MAVGEQPTFDLDLSGAAAMWNFHTDGGNPDPVGVYCHWIAADPAGYRYTARTTTNGEFIPLALFEGNGRQGVYLGLEWSNCRIDALKLSGGASPTLRVRAGNITDLWAELAPGESCEIARASWRLPRRS